MNALYILSQIYRELAQQKKEKEDRANVNAPKKRDYAAEQEAAVVQARMKEQQENGYVHLRLFIVIAPSFQSFHYKHFSISGKSNKRMKGGGNFSGMKRASPATSFWKSKWLSIWTVLSSTWMSIRPISASSSSRRL